MSDNKIGTSTPSDRVRKAHRKFLIERSNPRLSLKQFVKVNIDRAKEAKDDSANDEKEWKLNKKGAKNKERDQKTLSRIAQEKIASKSVPKKK